MTLVLVLAGTNFSAHAQDADSTSGQDTEQNLKRSPLKASLYSAVLPGTGQIYNKKYWKAPIVYAGMGTFIYLAVDNHQEFMRFKSALVKRQNDQPDEFEGKPKPPFYVLDMFPYPSGAGLHVGHPLGYIASDIYARFKRHQGYNVLHPQGYDSFGLPAEQYAIQTGQHPAKTTKANIKRYREQLDRIGFSFDWDREVRTSDPNYYKWTQWIFIQLHKKGLAEIQELEVNWCKELGTVLANEEVIQKTDKCFLK